MAAQTHDISRSASQFYFAMAMVFMLISFGGFAPSYLVPTATNRFDGPVVFHVHGALFFAWTILLAVQSRLAEKGRTATHRTLGLAGISLATAMFFSGVSLVVRGLDYGIAAGNDTSARTLAVVPLTQITLFAGFVAAAVASIRRPETHKRLMLMATANLLTAAIARVFGALFNPGARPNFAAAVPDVELALRGALFAALLVDLLIVVALVRDWRVRRPHIAYVIGLAVMLLVHALRGPLAHTPPWRSITDVLAALAR